MSKEYEIKTLGDFAKVPADRLDACLHDFAMWVGIKRGFEPAFVGIDGIEGVSAINVKVTQEFEETPQ